MASRSKKVLQIEYFIENQRWVGKGPRVRAEGPTLQATRRRARKAAEELYGEGVEIESTLLLSPTLQERIAANRARRAEARKLRTALREDTVELLDKLRNDLGASYEDAAELLGVDASVLMRMAHSTMRVTDED